MTKEESPLPALDSTERFQLHVVFSKTEEGKYLSENVRFNNYRPTDVSMGEWEALLGRDVNNLEHMGVMEEVANVFLRDERARKDRGLFSHEEEDQILLASVIHDWGEGVKGCEDITWRNKTEAHDQLEKKKMKELVAGIATEFLSDEDTTGLEGAIKGIIESTVFNRETKTGRAFNAIERIGYLRTGLRAWSEQERTTDPVIKNALQWVGADVLSHQIPQLTVYAGEYEGAHTMLSLHKNTISDAFVRIPDTVFDNYSMTEEDDERSRMRLKFAKARDAWHNFYI